MISFWDDKLPHTASSVVNTMKDDHLYLPINIPNPSAISNETTSIQSTVSSTTTSSSSKEIIGFHASFVVLGVLVIYIIKRD
ncbi:MAG: hypothetical protein ACXAC2_15250, partial [Candidatus Kariarchaeaceae archaeon]|jgi:hypothetical protein